MENIKGMKKNINVAEAVKIVKDYFRIVKGSGQIYGRDILEWLDFTTISVRPQTNSYMVVCKFRKAIFSTEYEIHKIEVDFEGDIVSDEMIDESLI